MMSYSRKEDKLDQKTDDNIYEQISEINVSNRRKLNGHPSFVIWMTGLSGAGKSTLANEIEKILHKKGVHTYILDGDNLRGGLNRDLGFSNLDRSENIRRVGEVAKLMVDAGIIVISAFISPFEKERQTTRSLFKRGEFIEVFIDTPLEICEKRDVKGLYKKARAGEITDFTGIDSPYERPSAPEITVSTDKLQPRQTAREICDSIQKNTAIF